MAIQSIPVYSSGEAEPGGIRILLRHMLRELNDHCQRAQKLIKSIALGILGTTPIIYETIRNKKIITFSSVQSLPIFKKTLIISATIFGMVNLIWTVKYMIQQIISIRNINEIWQDLQSKTYQNQYIIRWVVSKDLSELKKDQGHIDIYLRNVIDPNRYAYLYSYLVTQEVKHTLIDPSVSIFSTKHETAPSDEMLSHQRRDLASKQILSEILTEESQECLVWRDLLRKLAPHKDRLPEGTLESVAAMSLPASWVVKKAFGKKIDEASTLNLETRTYTVSYEIQLNPSQKREVKVECVMSKSTSREIKSLSTSDQFLDFLHALGIDFI